MQSSQLLFALFLLASANAVGLSNKRQRQTSRSKRQTEDTIPISIAYINESSIEGLENVFDADVSTCFEFSSQQVLDLEFSVTHVSTIVLDDASASSITRVQICDVDNVCSDCQQLDSECTFQCSIEFATMVKISANNSFSICEINIFGVDADGELSEQIFTELADALGANSSTVLGQAILEMLAAAQDLNVMIGEELTDLKELLDSLAASMADLESQFERVMGEALNYSSIEDHDGLSIWTFNTLAGASVDGSVDSCFSLGGTDVEFQIVRAAIQSVKITGSANDVTVQVCFEEECLQCIATTGSSFDCNNATTDRIIVSGAGELCEVEAFGFYIFEETVVEMFVDVDPPAGMDHEKVVKLIEKTGRLSRNPDRAANGMMGHAYGLRRRVEDISSKFGGPKIEVARMMKEPNGRMMKALEDCKQAGWHQDLYNAFASGIKFKSMTWSKLQFAESLLDRTQRLYTFVSGVLFCEAGLATASD